MAEHKPISSFVIEKKELSIEELWQLIFYCCHKYNIEERWKIEVSDKFNMITGQADGNDTGKFYRFLVASGLDKKIEIIRG